MRAKYSIKKIKDREILMKIFLTIDSFSAHLTGGYPNQRGLIYKTLAMANLSNSFFICLLVHPGILKGTALGGLTAEQGGKRAYRRGVSAPAHAAQRPQELRQVHGGHPTRHVPRLRVSEVSLCNINLGFNNQ